MNRYLSFAAVLLIAVPAIAQQKTAEAVRQHIDQALAQEPSPRDITIEVRQGNAVLTGYVQSEQDRERVEEATRATPGVRQVTNRLQVEPDARASFARRGPREISQGENLARQVKSAIANEPQLSGSEIRIESRAGTVVLSGTVPSEQASGRAVQVTRAVPGVEQVRNDLQVSPTMNDRALERRVLHALKAAEIKDSQVRGFAVEAERGTVVFRGEADGFRTVDRILATALMVPGVEDIRSEMTIASRNAPGAKGAYAG